MDSNIVLKPLFPPQDPTDRAILEIFQDLVDGKLTPVIAVKRMDALICEEHNIAQQTVERTEGNPDDGLLSGHYFVLHLVPRLAPQVPAVHPGQDRLVEVLGNIPRMPYREVTRSNGKKVNLWSEVMVEKFEQNNLAFWESRIFAHHSDSAERPEPSLENFSAFCARLFVAGMNMTTGRTIDRAPFTKLDHSKALPNDYEKHACAAAQWLLYAGAELFEMCEMSATYRKSSWETWRVKFTAIEASQNLSDHCRQLAGKVLQKMTQIEEAGITTNVVYEYGMMYMDGDTLVSSRPESRSYVGKRSQWNEYAEDWDI